MLLLLLSHLGILRLVGRGKGKEGAWFAVSRCWSAVYKGKREL